MYAKVVVLYGLPALKIFNLNELSIYSPSILTTVTLTKPASAKTFEASKVLAIAGFTNVTVVNIDGEYKLNSFKLKIFKAGKPYNTTTFAYSISNIRTKIFHEPHMFNKKTVVDNVDACIVTVDRVKVFGLVQVSMGLNQARLVQSKLNAKYFIPTGIAPNRTKGFIRYLLGIKEFYQQTSLLPASCQQVGDSLSL